MGTNLKEIRWKKDLSQEQLAIKTGLNRSTISSIETGDIYDPKVSTALKLSRALKVPVEDIFNF